MALINEQLIAKAKSKLPDAFTTTSSLAPPIRPAALPYHDHLMPIELYDNLDSSNNPLVPRDGDEADVAEAIRELGIEALAFYLSFHKPTVDGQWGIFYIGSRMRQFAALVARKLDLVPAEGWRVALEVVRRHEMFHFRFDLYALHQELTLARPLYNAYHENVYRKVFCTDSCFEEALANHLVITGVKHMSRAFGLSSTKLSEFLKSTYKNSPPGYSNFDDPLETLRGGLGGQILTGSTGSPLDEPQNVWVGSAGPFNRQSCSERVLISDAAGIAAPELKLRQSGRIWYFHKYDPDPFPSRPHGHDAEDGCKLSLVDGLIYDPRTKRQIGRESLKTLRDLRSRIGQQWPDVTLPILAGAGAINE